MTKRAEVSGYGLAQDYQVVEITKQGYYYYGRFESGRATNGKTSNLLAVFETADEARKAIDRVVKVKEGPIAAELQKTRRDVMRLQHDLSVAIKMAAKGEAYEKV